MFAYERDLNICVIYCIMNVQYKLINKEAIECVVYTSTSLFSICHEFLSLIDNEIQILQRYGVSRNMNDHLYILEIMDEPTKNFPIITNVIQFDVQTGSLKLKYDNYTDSGATNTTITQLSRHVSIKILLEKISNTQSSGQQPTISKQPIKQPMRRPIKQPLRQPTKRPIKQPTKRPIKQPTRQPIKQPTKQPIKQPVKQPVKQPTEQPNTDTIKLKNSLMKLLIEKEQEENELERLQQEQKQKVERLEKYSTHVREQNRQARIQKERDDQQRKKFDADRSLYPIIKSDLINNKIKDIPGPFAKKYKIFEQMAAEKTLHGDNSYNVYKTLEEKYGSDVFVPTSVPDIFNSKEIPRPRASDMVDNQDEKNNDMDDLGDVSNITFDT